MVKLLCLNIPMVRYALNYRSSIDREPIGRCHGEHRVSVQYIGFGLVYPGKHQPGLDTADPFLTFYGVFGFFLAGVGGHVVIDTDKVIPHLPIRLYLLFRVLEEGHPESYLTLIVCGVSVRHDLGSHHFFFQGNRFT